MSRRILIFGDIGLRLRSERIAIGINQKDFASFANASTNTQTRYETGISAPKIEYLLKICELGVDIGYILTGIRHDGRLGNDQETILKCYDQMHDSNRVAFLQIAESLARTSDVAKSIPVDHTTPPTLHDPGIPYRAQD